MPSRSSSKFRLSVSLAVIPLVGVCFVLALIYVCTFLIVALHMVAFQPLIFNVLFVPGRIYSRRFAVLELHVVAKSVGCTWAYIQVQISNL